MAAALTPFPTAHFANAIRALLSPLDYSDVDEWRRTVNRALRELLGADKTTFILPGCGKALGFSEEIPSATLAEFEPRFAPLEEKWALWQRAAALGVWSRELAVYPHQLEYYRSAYHNEFVVPNRLFDTLACTAPGDERVSAGARPSIIFHHENPRHPKFGQRGLKLLRLISPAFEVATDTFRRYSRHRAQLARALDTLDEAIIVLGLDGAIVHTSPALDLLLADEPERFRIVAEAQQLARTLATWVQDGEEQQAPPITVREVRGRGGVYRLRATCALTLFGPRPAPLVTIDRLQTPALSTEMLRRQFGLSRQEARVALLIADGYSNDQIARELSISAHTARHHTERLMLRLGIHSRAAIAGLLSGRKLATPPL